MIKKCDVCGKMHEEKPDYDGKYRIYHYKSEEGMPRCTTEKTKGKIMCDKCWEEYYDT